jgi:lipoprotein-anchoring transpeptidase ErfK/SrfK
MHPSFGPVNPSDKRGKLPYHLTPVLYRIVLAVLVAVGFGTAVPAAGVSLPVIPRDVQVGGIEVGGLISAQAEAKVAVRYSQPIRIFSGEKTWAVRPGRLGARPAIDDAIARAIKAKPGADIPLDIDVRQRAVRRYVARLNKRFAKPAVDAKLLGLSNLAPSFSRAKPGREVDQPVMVRRILGAVRTTWRGAQLQLAVRPVQPKVTPENYGPIIVIRRGSNLLYLYNGRRVVRPFTVATGQSQYPTPLGSFEIVVKERNPTWNPPPSDWAKDAEPIPPGPGNPLGTRWMGISAYAVGIHGTPDAASLGYSVSHGCIRMAIPDAEWMFEQVEVGTPVYIVSA